MIQSNGFEKLGLGPEPRPTSDFVTGPAAPSQPAFSGLNESVRIMNHST
jgi:hypothetical protein